MSESTTATLFRLSEGGVRTLTLDDRKALARAHTVHADMLDTLRTIENDAGQVPGWLWDRIQAVIAEAEAGPVSDQGSSPAGATGVGGRPPVEATTDG